MSIRRSLVYAGLSCSLAALGFSVGTWTTHRQMASQMAANDAQIASLARTLVRMREVPAVPSGTTGISYPLDAVASSGSSDSAFIDEIKRQIQDEMGLFPVRLLRARSESFVELNAVDNRGRTSYGTAGYLGNGHFITVKHGVVALDGAPAGGQPRAIASVTIRYKGADLPVEIVDTGDATTEVHPGDWAIVKVDREIDLPPLDVDTTYGYEFAEPIFRLGNDYSKGILLSTGYIGQRTANGLVTCLTDGHPGVSGGGVLSQRGDLVGIPVGRMQGDYRFSFILPLRPEMFRKVPVADQPARPSGEAELFVAQRAG